MKLSHELNSRKAGAIRGLILGLLLTAAGIGLCCDAEWSARAYRLDESFGVAALLIGIFVVVYSGHEFRRR